MKLEKNLKTSDFCAEGFEVGEDFLLGGFHFFVGEGAIVGLEDYFVG